MRAGERKSERDGQHQVQLGLYFVVDLFPLKGGPKDKMSHEKRIELPDKTDEISPKSKVNIALECFHKVRMPDLRLTCIEWPNPTSLCLF